MEMPKQRSDIPHQAEISILWIPRDRGRDPKDRYSTRVVAWVNLGGKSAHRQMPTAGDHGHHGLSNENPSTYAIERTGRVADVSLTWRDALLGGCKAGWGSSRQQTMIGVLRLLARCTLRIVATASSTRNG